MVARTMTIHFRTTIDPRPPLLLARLQQLPDISPGAFRDPAAAADARMGGVPFDSRFSCGPERHAVEAMPLLVQGHGKLPHMALTMFSVIFLASPSNIMVLSR